MSSAPLAGFFSIGALYGFFSVALGAFGAHAMRGKFEPNAMEVFHTGTQYLGIHALALLAFCLFRAQLANEVASFSSLFPAYAFAIGALIFSGTLFLITFTGIRVFGAITPIGGVLLLLGWLGFAWQAFQLYRSGQNS